MSFSFSQGMNLFAYPTRIDIATSRISAPARTKKTLFQYESGYLNIITTFGFTFTSTLLYCMVGVRSGCAPRVFTAQKHGVFLALFKQNGSTR